MNKHLQRLVIGQSQQFIGVITKKEPVFDKQQRLQMPKVMEGVPVLTAGSTSVYLWET